MKLISTEKLQEDFFQHLKKRKYYGDGSNIDLWDDWKKWQNKETSTNNLVKWFCDDDSKWMGFRNFNKIVNKFYGGREGNGYDEEFLLAQCLTIFWILQIVFWILQKL